MKHIRLYEICVKQTDTYKVHAFDEKSALFFFDEGKDLLDIDPELVDSVIEHKEVVSSINCECKLPESEEND